MVRKLLFVIVLLCMVSAMAVISGLLVLRYNVATYQDYWQGRANRPGDFIYVAIGDSAAQGLGASKPENGYVSLLAESIQQTTGRSVRVINLSTTGATVQDALRQQVPQLRNIEADLVTVEIGANDMDQYDSSRFLHDFDLLLQALPPGKAVVANMPHFGYRPAQDRNAQAANQAINRLADRYRLPVADLYGQLRNHQSPLIYASDFFHPNNRGYRLWHDAFQPVVENQLQQAHKLAE